MFREATVKSAEKDSVTDKLLGKDSKARELATDSSARKREAEKIEKLLMGMSESAPPRIVPYLKMLAPLVSFCIVLSQILIPVFYHAAQLVYAAWCLLPLDIMYIVTGLVICFFGGMYPTTMAALEAWRQCGGKQALQNLSDLKDQFVRVLEASEQDDKKDDDNDGIADVEQISSKELVVRKLKIAVTAADPELIDGALQGVYAGWIGVVAVLKVDFAKTIALGAAIGDFLYKTVSNPLGTILVHLLPNEYHKWVPTLIGYACKSAAIAVAWKVQRVISTFHSAIRGGLMAARGFLEWLHKKGVISIKPDESYVDELLGWALAAAGFYFQYKMGFAPPWFVSLLLWPLQFMETYIVWTISANPGPAAPA